MHQWGSVEVEAVIEKGMYSWSARVDWLIFISFLGKYHPMLTFWSHVRLEPPPLQYETLPA